MKIYRGAIFDMDGTLTDTLADLHHSMNDTLAHYNFPQLTFDQVKRFVGNGAKKFLLRSLPADVVDDENFVAEAFALYNETYIANSLRHVKPYAGIPDLLAALAAKKFRSASAPINSTPQQLKLPKKFLRRLNLLTSAATSPVNRASPTRRVHLSARKFWASRPKMSLTSATQPSTLKRLTTRDFCPSA